MNAGTNVDARSVRQTLTRRAGDAFATASFVRHVRGIVAGNAGHAGTNVVTFAVIQPHIRRAGQTFAGFRVARGARRIAFLFRFADGRFAADLSRQAGRNRFAASQFDRLCRRVKSGDDQADTDQ